MTGLLSRDQEQPKHHAGQDGQAEAAMRVDLAVGPGDQPDADQRQNETRKLKPVGHAFGANTEQHRQNAGDHRGDGSDDAHASDRQPFVQGRDAEARR